MAARTASNAPPVTVASPPAAAPAPAPDASAAVDDGLMSKLWKATSSWFGGDAPPADQSAASAPPAAPAPTPSAAATAVVPSIPALTSLAPPAAPSEEQSPRVVVVQGRRALPTSLAPLAPPPAPPPVETSPPVSPRGPRLAGGHEPSPGKPVPRAVSPAPSILSSSPLPESPMMRKQPQQLPPQPPADSRDSVSQWDAPRPAKSRYRIRKFELCRGRF